MKKKKKKKKRKLSKSCMLIKWNLATSNVAQHMNKGQDLLFLIEENKVFTFIAHCARNNYFSVNAIGTYSLLYASSPKRLNV